MVSVLCFCGVLTPLNLHRDPNGFRVHSNDLWPELRNVSNLYACYCAWNVDFSTCDNGRIINCVICTQFCHAANKFTRHEINLWYNTDKEQPIFYGYSTDITSFMNYEFSGFWTAATFTDPYAGRAFSGCTFTSRIRSPLSAFTYRHCVN